MEKKSVLIIAFLLVGLIAISPAFSEGKAEEGAKEKEMKSYTFTFATPFPATHEQQTLVIEPWAKAINEKSNGRITINVFAGGAISEPKAIVDDVASGAVDMAWTTPGYTPGRFPIIGMVEFPAHFSSNREATITINRLYQENEDFQKELGAYKVISLFTSPVADVYTKDEPIHSVEDFKGKYLRVSNEMANRALDLLGASAANIPMGDVYDAVERGVVDGFCTDHSAIYSYKTYEVIEHATDGLGFYALGHMFIMNIDTWNSLSPEDQAIFEEAGMGMDVAEQNIVVYENAAKKGYDAMVNANVEIYKWNNDEIAEFLDTVNPLIDNYIAEEENKGIPAREIYNQMLSIRDELR